MTNRIHLFIVASTVLACTFEGKLYDGGTAATTGTTGDSHGTWDTWQGTTLETSGPGPATTTAGPGWTSDTEGPPATSTTGVSDTEGPGWTSTTIVSESGWTTADVSTGEFPGSASDTTSQYTTSQPEEPVPCDGEAEPLDVEVLAYLESQIPANPDSDGTTGEDDDPNLLYVRFSSETFTCADPHERLSCDHQWELSLRIPTAFQAPGLYTVKWTDILGFGQETGNDAPADDCDGGGSTATGTLEIIAIDEDKVVGRLCHVKWSGLDNEFELDGKFIAPRCPQ
ncbi:hypothetical protein [Nannocystis pusilla]|uniref:hypothetical protein n=1 Tax=Nannocystis pusilla TaxID=889268 RepID=UPI003BF3C773